MQPNKCTNKAFSSILVEEGKVKSGGLIDRQETISMVKNPMRDT